MWDIIKVIIIILVIVAAWIYLSFHYSGTSWNDVLNRGRTLQITQEELWATRSPFAGSVIINANESTPKSADPQNEYIKIEASPNNTKAIDITGWSIESVVSETRALVPQAVLFLKMDKTSPNKYTRVALAPGEYAIVHTGTSPIYQYAKSFHTNICTGYLEQFIGFRPGLALSCPTPASILPPTRDNIRTYGAECVEFMQDALKCYSYRTEMPAKLLPACRDLIARKLTYNGCLQDSYDKIGTNIFNNGGWYLYLNHDSELWRNNYEALRLLDAQGRVVDVLKY